jgi:hypothetical protein
MLNCSMSQVWIMCSSVNMVNLKNLKLAKSVHTQFGPWKPYLTFLFLVQQLIILFISSRDANLQGWLRGGVIWKDWDMRSITSPRAIPTKAKEANSHVDQKLYIPGTYISMNVIHFKNSYKSLITFSFNEYILSCWRYLIIVKFWNGMTHKLLLKFSVLVWMKVSCNNRILKVLLVSYVIWSVCCYTKWTLLCNSWHFSIAILQRLMQSRSTLIFDIICL